MNKKPTPKNEGPKKDNLEINYGPDGRVLQKNQGKWEFCFHETRESVILEVEISKFMDSSLIDVDVHPTWIRVIIKGKVLQLLLNEEVQTENVSCERSRLTGHLVITMLKASLTGKVTDVTEVVKARKASNTKWATTLDTKAPITNSAPKNRRIERIFGKDVNPLTLKKLESKVGGAKPIIEARVLPTDIPVDDSFIDDADVPPLC
jgi:protein TilB